MKKLNIKRNAQGRNLALQEKILTFFRFHPDPTDSEVHAFAEEINMDTHDLEGEIYRILGSFIGYGESRGWRGTVDQDQLKMGIKEEMEHTNNPLIARKIAYDHLAKIRDYYTRLKKMEEEALNEEA